MNKPTILFAYIWRRGRDLIKWRFNYIDLGHNPRIKPEWYTTPGWYKVARKYAYRLTIDHDFPSKPLWLGKRVNGTWENTEALYEPLYVVHSDFTVASVAFRRSLRKGFTRLDKSNKFINAMNEAVYG